MPKLTLTEDKVLKAFIRQLIAERGLQLDAEEEARAMEQLSAQLEEQIDQAMVNALTDEQAMALEQLLDNEATDDDIEQFFEESGIDGEAIVLNTMNMYRDAFMAMNWEGL